MNNILYTIQNGVARISLNRPAAFNSFVMEMAKELKAALDDAASHPEVRAIYLTGEGKAFCAGEDLNEATDPQGPGMKAIVEQTYNPIITRLRTIEKPIVAAVNGVAAGAGANIALACDICVAAASANFLQAFSKIGLIPDSGGTFILPRLIGMQKATALMMLGEKISAADAHAMGMIYKYFPDETFAAESLKIAETLAQMPTKGLGYTKKLLNLSFSQTLAEQLLSERDYQILAGETYDYKEGVQAFLEKRKPIFKGK